MIKLEVKDGMYDTELYFEYVGVKSLSTQEALREIRGYASEFKTYCIINRKPYNIPHMINWFNKYTKYVIKRGVGTSGRIDL
jgi:hypothetical protein